MAQKSRSYCLPEWLPEPLRGLYSRIEANPANYPSEFLQLLKKLTLDECCKDIWVSTSPSGTIPDRLQLAYLSMIFRAYNSPKKNLKEQGKSLSERNQLYADIKKYSEKLQRLLDNTFVDDRLSINVSDSDFIYLNQREAEWLDNFTSVAPTEMLSRVIDYVEKPPIEAIYAAKSAEKNFLRNLLSDFMYLFPSQRIPRKSIARVASRLYSATVTEKDVGNVVDAIKIKPLDK